MFTIESLIIKNLEDLPMSTNDTISMPTDRFLTALFGIDSHCIRTGVYNNNEITETFSVFTLYIYVDKYRTDKYIIHLQNKKLEVFDAIDRKSISLKEIFDKLEIEYDMEKLLFGVL